MYNVTTKKYDIEVRFIGIGTSAVYADSEEEAIKLAKNLSIHNFVVDKYEYVNTKVKKK